MKEKLREALNKIGWDIKGRYPNEFIYDYKGKKTIYRVMSEGIELSGSRESTLWFSYKDIEIYELDTDGKIDCVGIKAKGKSGNGVFLQFYNHFN